MLTRPYNKAAKAAASKPTSNKATQSTKNRVRSRSAPTAPKFLKEKSDYDWGLAGRALRPAQFTLKPPSEAELSRDGAVVSALAFISDVHENVYRSYRNSLYHLLAWVYKLAQACYRDEKQWSDVLADPRWNGSRSARKCEVPEAISILLKCALRRIKPQLRSKYAAALLRLESEGIAANAIVYEIRKRGGIEKTAYPKKIGSPPRSLATTAANPGPAAAGNQSLAVRGDTRTEVAGPVSTEATKSSLGIKVFRQTLELRNALVTFAINGRLAKKLKVNDWYIVQVQARFGSSKRLELRGLDLMPLRKANAVKPARPSQATAESTAPRRERRGK